MDYLQLIAQGPFPEPPTLAVEPEDLEAEVSKGSSVGLFGEGIVEVSVPWLAALLNGEIVLAAGGRGR